MTRVFLDFEQPIAELEAKIQELRHASSGSAVDIEEEIGRLKEKIRQRTEQIFASLSAWQIAQLARHPERPHTLEFAERLCEAFEPLAGDRMFAEDPSIVGGPARLLGRPVMLVGHEKGRETREKIRRNFGMPRPEAYRKALRLFEMAARFRLPVVTLIDTPGAYPGVGAEERGQSEAIARNLLTMSRLPVPIVCCVIGEGGSGGALAVGVGDRLLMLQYATYSVISPEGCASILWKSAERAAEAAESLALTAPRLKELGLVDRIVPEPPGGAHRDPAAAARLLGEALAAELDALAGIDPAELVRRRLRRLRGVGAARSA